MKVAPGFIRKTLEKLTRQTKPTGAGHVLRFFSLGDPLVGQLVETAPDEAGPAAEVNHTSGQALVHRYVRLAGKGIAGIKSRAVAANSPLVAQRHPEGLSQREAAIFDGMMRIHRQIARAFQLQVNDRMLGEKRQHMIEKWYACPDQGLPRTFYLQLNCDPRFCGRPADPGLTNLHPILLNTITGKKSPITRRGQSAGWSEYIPGRKSKCHYFPSRGGNPSFCFNSSICLLIASGTGETFSSSCL